MARLIDADGLIDEICRAECEKAHADCDYRGGRCESVKAVMDSPTVGGWIAVTDRLPEVGVTCLVAFGDVGLTFSTLDASGKWYVVNGMPQPDYWMPLPERPGGKRVHT